jgi:predicted acetyltransferase
VTTEIRPIRPEEARDYLRVLPQETALPMWEPAPAAWHAGAGCWPVPAGPSEQAMARSAAALHSEGFRSQAAFVDRRLVGASALLSLELTVPGPSPVRMGGVTSTGVLPTHRRQGLLRALMTAMLRDCRERDEPLAGLSASEGGIYGRYGFSPATFCVRWELERPAARFLGPPPSTDRLELVSADVARAAWPSLHERARRARVGEVSARPGAWDELSGAARGTDGPLRFLAHYGTDGQVDGLAHFRTPWPADPALAGTVQVEAFEAVTSAAYGALWLLLTDLDLSRRVVVARRPGDEPLRWMLADPRALRVTRSADNLWLRLVDVRAALEARGYPTAASLVLDVSDATLPENQGRWRLDVTPTGATCQRDPQATPDVALSVDALASLYLGGVSPATLVAARRITVLHPSALATLTILFAQDPAPYNVARF